MIRLWANNARGKLNANILVSDTSLTLQAGQGARFPNPATGEYFTFTLINNSNVKEICRCTARSGDIFTTIVRGQEGTSPLAFSANDRVELRISAGGIGDKLDREQIVTISGDTTLTAGALFSEHVITAAAVVTLPLSTNPKLVVGDWIDFKSRTGAFVSIVTQGGDLLDGVAAPLSLGTNATARIMLSSAGNWILSQLGSTSFGLQTFTASGSWSKPAGAKLVIVVCVGAGGAGGGGRGDNPGTVRIGGAGGGGGAATRTILNAADLPSVVNVGVGAATTGGTGGTNANGGNGVGGSDSRFWNSSTGEIFAIAGGGGRGLGGNLTAGIHSAVGGGGGGSGGSASSEIGGAPALPSSSFGGAVQFAYGGAGAGATLSALSGGAEGGSAEYGGGSGGSTKVTGASTTPGYNGGISFYGASGGGSGGGLNAANTEHTGGSGGLSGPITSFGTYHGGGGAAGAVNGGAGGAGAVGKPVCEGSGGGGGGAQDSGTGGNGGNGGAPGGGGGGGGGGTTTGGNGGNGARGEVRVYTLT